MPNHVINHVSFTDCTPARRREILEAIQYDDNGENEYHGIGTIDFNKIIPMPESLDIESGTRTDHGIELCLTAANPLVDYFGEKKMSPDDFTALLARANRGKMFGSYRSSLSKEEIERITEHDSAESLMKVGSQALQNVVLFGSPDWYDWRCRNWGTKWNAYDIAAFDEDSDTITFETAWSAPHPILEKLSQMFPEVCISHYWADEDIGSNCGWAEYEGGEQIRGNDSMSDAEATEFAAQQWDYDIEKDLEMYMNRSRTKYICADNEEYDLIELFGKPAIFSNERLTNDDVPMNLFLYQLRDGENEFSPFGEIAEHITINHSGSVVTKEPIDLGEYGSIIFDESNLPNFVGDEITIGQLLRDEFSMDMPDDTEDIDIG